METKKTINVRGITYAEYRRLERRIRASELTWADAEKMGLCFPKAKQGRKRKPLGVPSRSKQVLKKGARSNDN